MLSKELVERALREIHPVPTPEEMVRLRTALTLRIPQALRKLAELAIPSNLLRKTYTVTATSGEAPLTIPLNAAEPLLLEGLRRAQVFITGFNHAAQYKSDRSSLSFPGSSQFAHWTLENQTLIIRDATGLDNYAGDAVIRGAPYIPLLANVPVTLEPILVEIMASYVQPAEVPAKDRRGDRHRG